MDVFIFMAVEGSGSRSGSACESLSIPPIVNEFKKLYASAGQRLQS